MKKKSTVAKGDQRSVWCASYLDLVMTKFSVFFLTLFLIYLFPQFFAEFEDWKWAFLVISIFLAIKPVKSFFKK